MVLEVKQVDQAMVIALSGDVDLQTSPEVRKGLLDALGSSGTLVVDMCEVSYIDSSGVASLVEAFQTAKTKGAFFSLANVSPAAMRVLNLARLDRVFTVHTSVEEAISAGA